MRFKRDLQIVGTVHTAMAVGTAVVLVTLMGGSLAWGADNVAPVAEAGLTRYVAKDTVRLDGSASYDPDHSGPLGYAWRQVSGPACTITDANTASPLISGPSRTDGRGLTVTTSFIQTQAAQECQFELVVSDGELTSEPDRVSVIIVPEFGSSTLLLQNPPFDPNKPTVVYFSGGDCVTGGANSESWGAAWLKKANAINFPGGYAPDTTVYEAYRTYYNVGDMLIVFLSKVAPEYAQPIQTSGWSTGGQPALDAGIRLNRDYKDPRYMVTHVTELDAPCRWVSQSVAIYDSANVLFRTSLTGPEQCWIDHYWGDAFAMPASGPRDVLGVYMAGFDHAGVPAWYKASLTNTAANRFNHGAVAGAYWSVVGPGKNLHLAATPGVQTYQLRWTPAGAMEFYDEAGHPGRLPEPVSLGAWVSRSQVSGDIEGVVLTCDESENAVGYELLVGSDPHRVKDFKVLSDTPLPPKAVIPLPPGETWWTIRARDAFGSTIHADPIRLDVTNLPAVRAENSRTGSRYVLLRHAIAAAEAGDVIVLDPGIYEENLEFYGKDVTVRSKDSNNPQQVAATIVKQPSDDPAVTFWHHSTGCAIEGLTIQAKTMAIACEDTMPLIRNCVVTCPDGIAVAFWWSFEPTLSGCTIVGQVREGSDPDLVAYWNLDETVGATADDRVGTNDAKAAGGPVWLPGGGKVKGAVQLDGVDDYLATGYVLNPGATTFSAVAWVKGGEPGQVILSQKGGANWLMADASKGTLASTLAAPAGRTAAKPLVSGAVITDGQWHRVGFVWNGTSRVLYVDGTEVARDTQAKIAPSADGLYIGAGKGLESGVFWRGLIDDVRVYNRAVEP
jgi:hypothetical protein